MVESLSSGHTSCLKIEISKFCAIDSYAFCTRSKKNSTLTKGNTRGTIFSLTKRRTIPKNKAQTTKLGKVPENRIDWKPFFSKTTCFCADFALRKWWSPKKKKLKNRSSVSPVVFALPGVERECEWKDIVFGWFGLWLPLLISERW